MEKAGEIEALKCQVPFVLSEKPRITVTLDFQYTRKVGEDEEVEKSFAEDFSYPEHGIWKTIVYEDVKGVLTRDSRTKFAWLEQRYGIHVNIIK